VPHEPFTPDNWPPVALNLITNGWIDEDDLVFGRAFASTQVYWELVHNMCSNYKSGTSSITVIGSDFGNGQCTFFDLDEDDTTVKLSLGVTISCVNFFNNSTWANQNAIGYGLPTDGNPHFTLNFANAESGSQSIVSYGLWNRTN
jgi:hypothetical protein